MATVAGREDTVAQRLRALAPSGRRVDDGITLVHVRAGVLAIRFLLELCLLGALGVGGWALAGGGMLGVILAVVAAVAGATVWGMWIGPRSARRVSDPARLALEIGLFLVAGLALWIAWTPVAGVAFLVASVVVAALTRIVGEPTPPAS